MKKLFSVTAQGSDMYSSFFSQLPYGCQAMKDNRMSSYRMSELLSDLKREQIVLLSVCANFQGGCVFTLLWEEDVPSKEESL